MRNRIIIFLLFSCVILNVCGCKKTDVDSSKGDAAQSTEQSMDKMEHSTAQNDDVYSSKTEEKQDDNREELKLLLINNNGPSAVTINAFSKSSDKYKISMVVVPQNKIDQYDIELLDKLDSIDMFELYATRHFPEYVNNNYILPLDEYLEGSGLISKNDFPEKIRNAFSIDGKLYALPKNMVLLTLAVPEKFLDGAESWDVWGYLEFLEKYPDAMSSPGLSPEDIKCNIMYYATSFSDNEFIDKENRIALFDREGFKDYLSRVMKLDIHSVSEEKKDRLMRGEPVIYKTDISKPEDLAELECECGTRMTLIGYPAATGEISGGICGYEDIFVISSLASNPEGAWNFIEYFLSTSDQTCPSNVPTRTKDFEDAISIAKDEEEYIFNDVLYVPLTDEQADRFRDAYNNSNYVRSENTIRDIVFEESRYYFSGDKELDEVCKIIQSRIQIILDEGVVF